ncbi:Hypothetical protein NTJ_02792 [Nesidiocoris tenuis]|uniref:Uncharacterized protein n=1 Tax=Nesidiocoris tenuis TaxID=355587 RepID=A0ABN7AFP1_9HEMI|nr:Hypothetical protein NTJ_02792 [Nesidiocoris tenuis]
MEMRNSRLNELDFNSTRRYVESAQDMTLFKKPRIETADRRLRTKTWDGLESKRSLPRRIDPPRSDLTETLTRRNTDGWPCLAWWRQRGCDPHDRSGGS